MESLQYNGFLIEPLIYQLRDGGQARGASLDRKYGAAVRVTNIDSQASAVSKLPTHTTFSCVGDARRAAEVFGRNLVDAPQSAPSDEDGPVARPAPKAAAKRRSAA